MKTFVALAFLLTGGLAVRPKPCKSPPLLTGSLYTTGSSGKGFISTGFLYDATRQRLRFFDFSSLGNDTSFTSHLLLYKEKVAYEIDYSDFTCTMSPLDTEFEPFSVPEDASLLNQVFLGSSSQPRQGLLVNNWMQQAHGGQVLNTVTESGCVPVGIVYIFEGIGWIVQSFYNIVMGITDPELLNPPSFCPDVDAATKEEPVNYFNLFKDKF